MCALLLPTNSNESHSLVAKVKFYYDAGMDAGIEAPLYKHSTETRH